MSGRRVVAILAGALLTGGCALQQDDRLRFERPPDGALAARGPVTVSWTFDGPPPAGGFAVFVDRAPMRPGRDVESLADHDPLCRRVPRCPDASWLADNGVYLTRRPQLTLPALPSGGGRRASLTTRRHEITVVVLDVAGVRRGDGAWTRAVYAPGGRRGR